MFPNILKTTGFQYRIPIDDQNTYHWWFFPHRIPEGVCMMYHSKDKHLNVPLTEQEGKRGGTDNSVTRISMKPTHLIGGYAQFSYGFNYYGPTGTQRDEMVAVRKLLGKPVY